MSPVPGLRPAEAQPASSNAASRLEILIEAFRQPLQTVDISHQNSGSGGAAEPGQSVGSITFASLGSSRAT